MLRRSLPDVRAIYIYILIVVDPPCGGVFPTVPNLAEEWILVKLGYTILEKSKYKKNRDPRHIYTYIYIYMDS